MPFTIAIIGRPNVGKSTLFNRLVGQKLALVDDEPGVTRDRREGEGRLGDLEFTVIDTAGLDEGAKGSLTARMQEQTEAAIGLADALMFVVDARAGLTPNDRAFADFARRANKPVVLVANKSEGKQGDAGAMEAYALGLGEPIQISAEHGEGLSELYDALRALMPEPVEAEQEFDDDDVIAQDEDIAKRPIRVAIVGRPNAGKSTLINHLLGEERLLTSAEAGTTRDSISVEINWKGRDFRVFDTAGLRRRSRIEEKLEKLSVADALRAVRFAEVVVLVMDAQNKFEEQDLRIADLIEREGRALVIAVNKWDLMGRQQGLISALQTDADQLLPQVKGMPIVAVSGLMGEGIDRMMTAIEQAYAVWNRRVPTASLNRWFEQAVDANPPPAVSGRRLKLNYITQAKARPPSFVLFCSRADAVPQSYLRYLVNSLREFFELPGTPVRITLREKANPFAHKRKRAVVSEGRPESVVEASPVRSAAVAFIFITILLDTLALGLVIPVLPKLVESFVDNDTARAARIFGLFGTAWAAMQFFFSPVLGGLSDRFGRRPVVLLSNFGLALDYVLMALAPSLTWLFVGRVISGITSASISTSFAYIADITPPERRAAVFGKVGAAFGGRVYPRARARRIAGRHGSAVAVLGRGGPEFHQYALRLADPARIAAAGSARAVALEKRKSLGCAASVALRFRARGTLGGEFLCSGRPCGSAVNLRALCDLSLRLGCGDRRPDAGDGRHLRDGRAGRRRRADR